MNTRGKKNREKVKVLEFIRLLLGSFAADTMKASLKTVNLMGREFVIGPMVLDMRENGRMATKMERGLSTSLMGTG